MTPQIHNLWTPRLRIDALPAPTGPVQRLEWRLTPSVQAAIQVAHRRLAADVDQTRKWIHGFMLFYI